VNILVFSFKKHILFIIILILHSFNLSNLISSTLCLEIDNSKRNYSKAYNLIINKWCLRIKLAINDINFKVNDIEFRINDMESKINGMDFIINDMNASMSNGHPDAKQPWEWELQFTELHVIWLIVEL
jgi:hypothetical protein